jgi:hypothetical protein
MCLGCQLCLCVNICSLFLDLFCLTSFAFVSGSVLFGLLDLFLCKCKCLFLDVFCLRASFCFLSRSVLFVCLIFGVSFCFLICLVCCLLDLFVNVCIY